ncbi:MAG: hypothetical protein EOR05_06865 [Mesorhizobium sp.]|nr:MAG: hypothetical protein EOR05_06865 [Mesorhizobium sp.]
MGVGDWRKPKRHPISPLAGEMSGRTEGGVKDRQLSTSALPTRISLRARLRSIDRSEGSPPLPAGISPLRARSAASAAPQAWQLL